MSRSRYDKILADNGAAKRLVFSDKLPLTKHAFYAVLARSLA